MRIQRASAVLRRFGMNGDSRPRSEEWRAAVERAAAEIERTCAPGLVILIRGASGSGKSLLLDELRRRVSASVDVDDQHLGELAAVDCLHWMELERALELLGRFGLAEVYSYLSPACRLSTGQRFRLRLAMAFGRLESRGGGTLIADEFATQLDDVGAAIIARNLRRAMVGSPVPICAVVASCHDGLEQALRPDVVVNCDFGSYELRGAA